jgi:uncharacterized membrane protein YeaQ/YmgE (transglycosylase-associated protein family)
VIGTIIGAIVVGLVVGGLARLIMPGKQNVGVVLTVILGAIGALLGTWVSYNLGYSNQNGGFKIIPFLIGRTTVAHQCGESLRLVSGSERPCDSRWGCSVCGFARKGLWHATIG